MSSETFERLKETVGSFVVDYKNRVSRKLKSAQTSNEESERLLAETERSIESAYRNVSVAKILDTIASDFLGFPRPAEVS